MKLFAFLYHTLTGGFLAYRVLMLLINAATFPRLRPQSAAPGVRVSLLVPARDEEANLRRNLPGLLAQGAAEVLVLDDGSRDGTAETARQLGARVLTGEPLPPGWVGKTWACQQLAQAASGDVLIFTDADVTWHPGALGAVLAQLRRSGADLLSVWPRQRNVTPGERLLTPLAELPLIALFPLPLLRFPVPAASAANGQVMAFRRASYWHLGGHAAVRGEVLEDVRFAHRLRRAGGNLSLALGQECISVRMYRSYPDSVQGFGKNLLAVHGGHRALLALSFAFVLASYTVPWLGPVPGARRLRLASVAERLVTNLIAGRRQPADLAEGLLGPLTPLLMLPVYRRALRRQVTWKGREYRQ
ncbi:glycosyltransferase [Deinococcus wulumuqiensis]|uniref:Glycosyltransferase n=1 Tax=Deinococcus wulumuqiensis TaxID=980427 RepID=A0A345IIZ2_9DEIO|nr:glycosyltransferase family 2 protein [Deinococcus wulumuqiensis]AXG99664.1 glycosyltransferase [Deinococcus wulumuqiensis]